MFSPVPSGLDGEVNGVCGGRIRNLRGLSKLNYKNGKNKKKQEKTEQAS